MSDQLTQRAAEQMLIPAVVSPVQLRQDWWQSAACRNADLSPDAWFPVALNEPTIKEAKKICYLCPVRHRCLAEAHRTRGTKGIWGGQDEKQRSRTKGSA